MEEDDPVIIVDLPEEEENQNQNRSHHHKRDGERSTSRGPCPCGFRHWCEGKEYDFVFQWPGINVLAGFNLEDNAFQVATDYVTRHHTSQRWDHRHVVAQIANAIMKQTEEMRASGVKHDKKVTEKSSSFDPFKEDLNVPQKGTTRYNKVTGEFVKTTYASTDKRTPEEEAEIRRKQAILEENQKKLLKEKEEEEKRKAGIVEIIRRDRKEREEETKMQLEHRLNNPTGKIPKVEDGVVVWVDAPQLKTPGKSPTKEVTLRTISDLSDSHHHHHHSHHHHEHHPLNSDSDSDDDDVLLEKLPRLPKMFWNDSIFLKLFAKHGEEVTRAIMKTVGFGEAELDEIMIKGKEHIRKHNKKVQHSTPTKLVDNGRRLGSASPESSTSLPPEQSPSSPEPSIPSSVSASTLTVNTDSPTTSIKVRLIDGTTKEITVNHTHTIQDIVEHLRSISGVSEFKLVNISAYPRKTLTELKLTVKEANLFNSNLTQTR